MLGGLCLSMSLLCCVFHNYPWTLLIHGVWRWQCALLHFARARQPASRSRPPPHRNAERRGAKAGTLPDGVRRVACPATWANHSLPATSFAHGTHEQRSNEGDVVNRHIWGWIRQDWVGSRYQSTKVTAGRLQRHSVFPRARL